VPLRKSYMAPFWNMVALVVVFVAFNVYIYFSFFIRVAPDIPFYLIYRVHFIELAILIAETVTYWIMRKWKIRKYLIWFHIGCIYGITIGLPIMNVVLQDIADNFGVLHVLANIRFITTWALICIAHIFFASAIINGYRNKKTQDEADLFESI
jgi:hypothetical protein